MLTLIYLGKLILVVVLISILLAFVLAPIVDALGSLSDIPGTLESLLAVLMLVGALGSASYASYSRALDFMQELPKYKAKIQGLGAKIREQAEQIQKTTDTVSAGKP